MSRNGFRRDAFSEWNSRGRNNVEASLRTVNLSYNQALTREQMLRNLQAQNRGLVSRNALIQSGNDIALFQVQETRALENLVRQQVNMQAEYEALELAREAEAQAGLLEHGRDLDKGVKLLDEARRTARERDRNRVWRVGD